MFRLYGRGGLLHPTLNVSNYRTSIPAQTKGKIVLNVGAGGHRLASHIINLDLSISNDNVDILGDAHALPIHNKSVDFVLLLAVLEHIPELQMAVREMYRVLQKGGEAFVYVPFLHPYHGSEEYYHRNL